MKIPDDVLIFSQEIIDRCLAASLPMSQNEYLYNYYSIPVLTTPRTIRELWVPWWHVDDLQMAHR